VWRSADGGGRGAQTGAGGKAGPGHVGGVGRRGFVSSLVTSPAEALLVGGGGLNLRAVEFSIGWRGGRWPVAVACAVYDGKTRRKRSAGAGHCKCEQLTRSRVEWGLCLAYHQLLACSCVPAHASWKAWVEHELTGCSFRWFTEHCSLVYCERKTLLDGC
jgi:hypothetical protein